MKDNIHIYHIIVNSNQNFVPVSQKKILKVVAFLLTHASKSVGLTGPFSINFEGANVILRAIFPRARLILIPGHNELRYEGKISQQKIKRY